MIRFECPGCRAVYNVKDDKAGKTGTCPTCQTQFVIPHPVLEPVAPPTPPPAPVPPAPAPVPPAPPEPVAAAPEPEPPAWEPVPPPSIASRPVAVPNTVEIAPCPGCGSRMSVLVADLGVDIECPKCHKVYRARKPGSAIVANVARPQTSLRRPERDDDDRDYDRDDDDDDRPKSRRRKRPRDRNQSWIVANRSIFRIISGIMSLLTGTFQLMCAIGIMVGGTFLFSALAGLSTQIPNNPNNPNAVNPANPMMAAAGVGTVVFLGCGLVIMLISLFYFLSGVSALSRKGYGRVLMIIVGVLATLAALLTLANTMLGLISLDFVRVILGIVQVLFYVVHALSSFFAAFGPGAEREFNR